MQTKFLIEIAETILEAQKIREESWSKMATKYSKRNEDAARMATKNKHLARLVSLLNDVCWNDAQIWAETVLEETKLKQ